MAHEIIYTNNKGGRPPKALKRNKALTVKCTTIEQTLIASKAKQAGITVSEYLRTIGLNGKIDRSSKRNCLC